MTLRSASPCSTCRRPPSAPALSCCPPQRGSTPVRACGHVLSPPLPDAEAFYSSEYRISLESDDHDQIYEIRDGQPIYRTTRQAEVFLEQINAPEHARILDYGAAKATTLR